MLTTKDLQNFLKVGRDKAYALMHADGFPSIRIGGRYYVSQEALVQWLRRYEGREFTL